MMLSPALLLAALAISGAPEDAELPKVLFFANPMKSDNDVVRRTRPGDLSVAERHFDELSKGVFDVTIRKPGWLTIGSGTFHDTVTSRAVVPVPLEHAAPQ